MTASGAKSATVQLCLFHDDIYLGMSPRLRREMIDDWNKTVNGLGIRHLVSR